MREMLSCHYCGEPLSLATLCVLDVPAATGNGAARSVPAPHCPACAAVVRSLTALGADPRYERSDPAEARRLPRT